MNNPRLCPVTQPAILQFSGPDTVRYLNGQLTQDISSLNHHALPSCLTNAKGRLEYFVRVSPGPDPQTIWISLPKDQAHGLQERLERYLIADDVEITDLTDSWIHSHSDQPNQHATLTYQTQGPFGQGYDLWWPANQPPKLEPISTEELNRLEITNAWPRWNHELTAGMLPPEAGLDQYAISYQKGCYIGQEVLSRIKSVGRVNRRLAIFEVPPSTQGEATLFLSSNPVGTLTRVAKPESPSEPTLALGYLKKQAFEQSTFSTSSDTASNDDSAVKKIRWA